MQKTNSTRKLSRTDLKKIIGGSEPETTTCTADCGNHYTLTCSGYHVYCIDRSNCSSKDEGGNVLEYKICESPTP